MEDVIEFLKTAAAQHWPFFLMSFTFGFIGQFMKHRIWTKERATRGKFWFWARATMPLHAPAAGLAFGTAGWLVFKETFPASPTVTGLAGLAFYYTGAGVLSAWVFNFVRHFAESKGVVVSWNDSARPPPLSSEPPTSLNGLSDSEKGLVARKLGPNEITPQDPVIIPRGMRDKTPRA